MLDKSGVDTDHRNPMSHTVVEIPNKACPLRFLRIDLVEPMVTQECAHACMMEDSIADQID